MINLTELLRRESEQVEWKENVADISEVVETICAFANDYSNLGGGYVVCGAKESRDEHGFARVELVGLTASRMKKIEGEVLSICRQAVDPPLVPIVEELDGPDSSRRVLVFTIPATPHAHSYRRKAGESPVYYIRTGKSTVIAQNGLYRELFVRKGAMEPWDRRAAPGSSLSKLDLLFYRFMLLTWGFDSEAADKFLEADVPISAFVPPLVAREPLTATLRLRNFAILLFGKNPTDVSAGAYLVISHYPGPDRSEPLAKKYEFTGSIIGQAEKAVEHLSSYIPVLYDKADPKPNQPKYPIRALQESIVNALVHRDYEMREPTRATVFSDRIEILSPGGLLRTVDEEAFRAGDSPPIWRNQSLAYFFNKLQLSQAEGQGITTIIRSMREEGCPDPEFNITDHYIITTLRAHPRHRTVEQLTQS